MINLLGFGDFTGFKTFGADVDPFNGSLEGDLDPLQIRTEHSETFTDNLGTRTAGSFDLTASFIMLA